jgi:rare lipoprotein A
MAPAGHVPLPSTVSPPANAASPHAPPATYGLAYSPTRAARERGKASYYHDSLAGNRTASGDVYDPSQVSAAHRTLPFGTVVDVVRGDGRWVRVRINDRGPFAKGRIIDLSRRAAEQLGIIEAGVADVTLYVVASPTR